MSFATLDTLFLCWFHYIAAASNTSKGSKLKPDAPEFVPNQPKTTSTDSPTKSSGKEAAKVQKKKEREERKTASLAKKAGKKVAKQLDGPDGQFLTLIDMVPADHLLAASTADESTRIAQYDGQMTEGEASTTEKPKLKRARFSRRYLAKSEPGNRAIGTNDGQQDSDLTAVSSGEGQPLLASSTVVSHSMTNLASCAYKK